LFEYFKEPIVAVCHPVAVGALVVKDGADALKAGGGGKELAFL